MKKILIPTDFSDASKNAYQYAKKLTETWQGTLEIVHCWKASVNPFSSNVKTQATKYQAQLDDFCEAVKHPQKAAHLSEGAPTEQLVDWSKNYDLIIMGTAGEHDAFDHLLGSTSSQVAREANCPVLLIPSDFAYGKGIRQMQYGVKFDGTKKREVRQVIDFAKHFDAKIHFVYVKENEEDTAGMLIEDTLFADLFEQGTKGVEVHLATLENADPMKGLHQYAMENEIDLSVIATQERTWWERLMSSNTTQEIVFNLNRPLLVLHLD